MNVIINIFHILTILMVYLRKEILKSNFRQYGQMKSRSGKSQRRKEQKKQDQGRESQKTEDAGARKGTNPAKHCFSNNSWLRRVER
jgi:hypothetical protein